MDLSNNGISDVGASSLRDALERNFGLVKFDLSGNNITASLLKDIEELVCTNNKRVSESKKCEEWNLQKKLPLRAQLLHPHLLHMRSDR